MTSSAIAELDRPSRVACSDLLAVFLCPIKKHLNHFFELEGAAESLEHMVFDFAGKPLISICLRILANAVGVLLKCLPCKGRVVKIDFNAPTRIIQSANLHSRLEERRVGKECRSR